MWLNLKKKKNTSSTSSFSSLPLNFFLGNVFQARPIISSRDFRLCFSSSSSFIWLTTSFSLPQPTKEAHAMVGQQKERRTLCPRVQESRLKSCSINDYRKVISSHSATASLPIKQEEGGLKGMVDVKCGCSTTGASPAQGFSSLFSRRVTGMSRHRMHLSQAEDTPVPGPVCTTLTRCYTQAPGSGKCTGSALAKEVGCL